MRQYDNLNPYRYTMSIPFGSTTIRGLGVSSPDQRNIVITFNSLPSGGFYFLGLSSYYYLYEDLPADLYLPKYQYDIIAFWQILQAGTPQDIGDPVNSISFPSPLAQNSFYLDGFEDHDFSKFPVFIPGFTITLSSNIVISNYSPTGNIYYLFGGVVSLGFKDDPDEYILTEV